MVFDIGGSNLKALFGSRNDTETQRKPFFELHGVIGAVQGISSKGFVQNRTALLRSVRDVYDKLCSFSGYDINEAYVLYTHPNTRFLTKTMGTTSIKNPEGIHITEEWLEQKKEYIREQIARYHRQEKCTYFSVQSICADGEEIMYDPYEYTAMRSIVITYNYALTPATYMEHIREIMEQVFAIVTIHPVAVANGFFLSKEQKDRGALVCDIGTHTTTVSVYRDGRMIGMHTFPFGGATITNEIALSKKISLEEAEQIKYDMHLPEQPLKKREVQTIEKKLAAHIKADILGYIKSVDAKKQFPGGVLLIGSGAQYPNLDAVIEKTLGLYTEHAKISYHIQNQQHARQTTWQSAYGLLHALATRTLDDTVYAHRTKTPFWHIVTRWLHAVSKILR